MGTVLSRGTVKGNVMATEENQVKAPVNREKVIIKTSLVGIIGNTLLALFKFLVGVATNSIAVTLDAINNLSDALSSVITIIGTKLASRPPNKEHPLGYGRLEYMSGLVVSFIVLYAGITALIDSVKKIITPEVSTYTSLSLWILAGAIVVKFLLGYYTKKKGQEVNSDSLVASGEDSFNDGILSISVLASAIIYLIFNVNLEAYVGAIISIFIIKSGIELVLDGLNKITGERISHKLSQEVKETIQADPDVQGAYDLFLDDYGPRCFMGSVHVEVDSTMPASEIDTVSRRIQRNVYKAHGVIIATVGVYSVNKDGGEESVIRRTIRQIVLAHKEVIQFHGFYIDLEKKEISFDVIIDFAAKNREELYEQIVKEVQTAYPEYTLNVTLDLDLSD